MSEVIDARGLACPAPVVKTRNALNAGATDMEVLVDNPTARDNVSRFAASRGCSVKLVEEGTGFRLLVTAPSGAAETPGTAAEAPGQAGVSPGGGGKTVVVMTGDTMGRGNDELGKILVQAFLNTLAESESPPWRLVLFNRGVCLAVEGADTVEALSNLAGMGVEILACGTCLDFFGLKEKLAVGRVSNMYEILDTMLMATNSVSI